MKIFHDDKEGGWSGNEFNGDLKKTGITRRFTMRAEPHSNGKAERAMRSISDDATSILYESNLPPMFWARAVAAVNWKHNRTPCSSNPDHGIPFTLFYGRRPDISLARVFGSLACEKWSRADPQEHNSMIQGHWSPKSECNSWGHLTGLQGVIYMKEAIHAV